MDRRSVATERLWIENGKAIETVGSHFFATEKDLEDLLWEHPQLIGEDLVVIGRQLRVGGGIIDLLAIDAKGVLLVIEIKRTVTDSRTVGQGAGYLESVGRASLSTIMGWASKDKNARNKVATIRKRLGPEIVYHGALTERDVALIVAGETVSPSAMAAGRQLRVPVGFVEVSILKAGQKQLYRVRKTDPRSTTRGLKRKARTVRAIAAASGLAELYDALVEIADECELHQRPWTRQLMIAPPYNKTRYLYTIGSWSDQKGRIHVWVNARAFSEFYNVTISEARRILDCDGSVFMSKSDIVRFRKSVKNITRLPR